VTGSSCSCGTNHLGHFALQPGCCSSRCCRCRAPAVVTVSSIVHRIRARINFDDLQGEAVLQPVAAYSQSKLANLMFTYELHRRLSGAGNTIAVAAHPGLAATELRATTPAIVAFFYVRVMTQKARWAHCPCCAPRPTPACSRPVLRPGGIPRGQGLPGTGPSSGQSHDTAIQRRLWTVSQELTGGHVPGLTRPLPKAGGIVATPGRPSVAVDRQR